MRIHSQFHLQIPELNPAPTQIVLPKTLARAASSAAPPSVGQQRNSADTDAVVEGSDSLIVEQQNRQAALPPIQDSAEADEALALAAQSIQQQPAAAYSAQANQLPQAVLDLLNP